MKRLTLICVLVLLTLGVIWHTVSARMSVVTVGGGVPAVDGCSGSYGNQLTTDLGALGDGSSSECFVRQITGACNGNIASISVRMNYFGTSVGYRYHMVLYSDSAGAPSSLLGTISSTASGDTNGPAWNTESGSIATGATTFWAGVCKEATASIDYSSTSGGATRTEYNCSSAYNNPPATWGTGCTTDGDYNAYNLEIYISY